MDIYTYILHFFSEFYATTFPIPSSVQTIPTHGICGVSAYCRSRIYRMHPFLQKIIQSKVQIEDKTLMIYWFFLQHCQSGRGGASSNHAGSRGRTLLWCHLSPWSDSFPRKLQFYSQISIVSCSTSIKFTHILSNISLSYRI